MPVIADDFLDSVIYLYRSEFEAKEGENAGGSGFLVSVPSQNPNLGPNGGYLFAVTNRHVIDEGATVARLNTADGGFDVFPFPKSRWVPSATDDLAVCPMPLIDGAQFRFKAVPTKHFLRKEHIADWGIGPGDTAFMVGRFINHEGIQRNQPTVRFGSIAQMPWEPIRYELGGKTHDQESFLVEVRSIGGYSGSPVFLFVDPLYHRDEKKSISRDRNTWLLGIDWGHIRDWVTLHSQDRKPMTNAAQVPLNTGVAGVIPAWKLLELLEIDSLKKGMKQAEDDFIARRAVPGAVADSISPPATDENPTHREDFNSLVGAAARKREQED